MGIEFKREVLARNEFGIQGGRVGTEQELQERLRRSNHE